MKAHVSDIKIQEYACSALVHLAEVPDCRVSIVSSGGLDRIRCAMGIYLQSEAVQKFGSKVLGRFNETSAITPIVPSECDAD